MLEVLGLRGAGNRAFRHTGSFDGACLTVTYLVDLAEHESRLSRGLGAVTDEFLLAGLLSLPTEDMAAVEPRFARALRSADASRVSAVIRDPEGGFWGRRRLGVPVEILELETESARWRRGREVAHQWVGYGPRLVNVYDEIQPFEIAEASHYGIGLVARDGVRILEPAPYSPQRWTSARWRLSELVYTQFLKLDA